MAAVPSNSFQQAGRVSAINEHHGSAKHATIEVTHGKRKRSKGADGQKGDLVGYDRPTSRVVVPKSHAKNFTMGQQVNVGVTPRTDADGDDDGDETDQMGDTDEYPVQSAPAPSGKGKGGKKPAGKAKRAPGQRPILQAMTRNRGK